MGLRKFNTKAREVGSIDVGGRRPISVEPKDRSGSSVPMGKRTAKRRLKTKLRKKTKKQQRQH